MSIQSNSIAIPRSPVSPSPYAHSSPTIVSNLTQRKDFHAEAASFFTLFETAPLLSRKTQQHFEMWVKEFKEDYLEAAETIFYHDYKICRSDSLCYLRKHILLSALLEISNESVHLSYEQTNTVLENLRAYPEHLKDSQKILLGLDFELMKLLAISLPSDSEKTAVEYYKNYICFCRPVTPPQIPRQSSLERDLSISELFFTQFRKKST